MSARESTAPLIDFLPPVQQWFRQSLGEPTTAQRLGWPAIRASEHTLILAPTGSGKTLAAFLACLDYLWRLEVLPHGIQVLYISPLKALNNDIYRNLQVPLAGVAAQAQRMGQSLPELQIAVRTGDTPAAERQRLLRRPPHILITTPESLHLLLTSRARETLRSIRYCIVDEIHALCANKRGVFLSLLLERLEALNPKGFVRIGLSATHRPLEEVARYLGGRVLSAQGAFEPRPVTIIDAGLRKDLDLRVINPVEHFGPLPEKSIWPSIYRLLSELIQAHRSTIIFANNRRTVERITANLNADKEVARAHHGSVALEVRQQTEQALKEGRLPAVVATASLELGIDMGAVDLVCQVESPGSVARALQRVGRAGHLVGQKSKGRLIPKMPSDLLEQAVLAREMAAGRVEAIRVPQNCLDILAQQVVASVAMDDWDVSSLFARVRQAYPFRDLTPQAFESVLEMITGRYRFDVRVQGKTPIAALQPRISWDRIHQRLQALPGSRQLALVGGGTIPDTGQYAAYTSNRVRIGELDEEFIYERRIGDTFLLGTNSWRLERIETDRVIVTPAQGAPAMVPFWRGEKTGRSHDLGLAIGGFVRQLSERLDQPDCLAWLESEYHLDAAAAHNLRQYVRRQRTSGVLPTDETLVIEAFRDPLGDWQVALLSPFGSRLHLGLRLALEARLRARLGYRPQCLHHDDGLLIRLTDMDQPVLDLFEGITAENVKSMIVEELADSALFALRFRQNAARALLFPRGNPGQRAPLWLQRLRGRDLLQVARSQPDFPIVVETFRECFHDHLDLPHLQMLLRDIESGRIRVQTRRAEAPSPFAAGLLFAFTAAMMYQYDDVEPGQGPAPALDAQLLDQLVSPQKHLHLLDPRAIHQVECRLRGFGQLPRTATEMSEWLRRLGDLSPAELEGPMAAFLEELQADGRATTIQLPQCRNPERWILAEDQALYERAFGLAGTPEADADAAEQVLTRFLQTHALVGLQDLLDRYPLAADWAARKLQDFVQAGRLVPVPHPSAETAPQWAAPANLEQVERASLALLRNEVVPCSPAVFSDFLIRWQHAHPLTRTSGPEGLTQVLERLEGLSLPIDLWEQTVLPTRVAGYQPRWLDETIAGGDWVAVGQQPGGDGTTAVAFWNRLQLSLVPPPDASGLELDEAVERVLESLRQRGASFVADLAQETQLLPSAIRSALWSLLRQRLVTNDRFDVLRRGEEILARAPDASRAGRGEGMALAKLRRRGITHPEGRWSLIRWGHPEAEERAVHQAALLLERYGIVARELALLDPSLLPWRMLYEVLNKMEWAGEVRRGYFVEGLTGAQFALPEAARALQSADLPSTATAPVVLLHSQDPANLYGSGAPFDIALLDGGTRSLARRPGNWLVLRAGRPILLIEGQGKRLTALTSASSQDVADAVRCLPQMLERSPASAGRHKLTVEEWNGQPVTSTEGKTLLEAVGFVHDYQGLTLYAAWR